MRSLLLVVLLLATEATEGLVCTESRSQWTRSTPSDIVDCPRKPLPTLCYVIANSTSKLRRYGCTLDLSRLNESSNAINVCDGRTVNRCDEAMFRVDDSLSICCCAKDNCNAPSNSSSTGAAEKQFKVISRNPKKLANTNWRSPERENNVTGILIGAVCGVGLLAVVVVGALVGYRRFRSFHIDKKDPELPRIGQQERNSERSSERSQHDFSDMNPVVEKSSQNAVHLDCTDTVVSAQISEKDQKSLLKALKRNNQLKGVLNATRAPMIEKVVAFGTSDDITVIGSVRQLKEEVSESGLSVSSDINDTLLVKLIRNGPRQFAFQFEELIELLSAATDCFARESSLLEVPVPCVVYGDIHGQYSDLHRWFNLNGWPNKTRCVFLGDFVDRGSHGIEVVALIVALKLSFPDQVFICRGNHEEESLNKAYSFYEEVCLRFPTSIETEGRDGPVVYSYFKKLFMQIPLAALIGGRILGMHGGISPKMESVDAIRRIERPIDDFEVGSLACDLVWSDPDTDGGKFGFRPNLDREPQHGIGQLFTAEAVKNICRKLKIDFIIRGHQAPLHGYALFADGYLMTLFSAPGYKGTTTKDVNMGACVEIQKDMIITIKQLKVSEKFRKNRVDDVERMKANRKLARKLRDSAKDSKSDSCEK